MHLKAFFSNRFSFLSLFQILLALYLLHTLGKGWGIFSFHESLLNQHVLIINNPKSSLAVIPKSPIKRILFNSILCKKCLFGLFSVTLSLVALQGKPAINLNLKTYLTELKFPFFIIICRQNRGGPISN